MSNKIKKVLISGFEIGGQMQLLVEELRRRWIPATSTAYNKDFRGYQNDINLSGNGNKSIFKRFFYFVFAVFHYDVFHFFWGVSLFGIWKFHLIDLPILKFFNKKIIVHFRGLDIIDIKYFDYLRDKERGLSVSRPPINRPGQQKMIKKWIKYADHILISEPDLYEVVPNAILSPQVVDVNYWVSQNDNIKQHDVFKIVHAPSSRRKKGTDFIEKSIKVLNDEGYKVELILAEDMPFNKIKDIYQVADIGIDQVLYGWHGKVSVELMSMGKPVLCYIREDYLKYRKDLPIINCNVNNLTNIIRDCIKKKYDLTKIGIKGREYALKYHSLENITNDLCDIYGFKYNTLAKSKITNAEKW